MQLLMSSFANDRFLVRLKSMMQFIQLLRSQQSFGHREQNVVLLVDIAYFGERDRPFRMIVTAVQSSVLRA